MDKNAIKKYAVWARRELISRVSQRAALYEITADGYGDQNASSVHGRLMSYIEKKQRTALIAQIKSKGYEQVMEEIAYTWFNRFSALRFMEVNGYLPTRIRVFTNDDNAFKPQILDEAINMEMDGLDMQKVYDLKNANDDDALFKYMIITQCNALSSILPGMFQRISDYTELLFPDNLLREGSVVEQMIAMIPQEDWTDQVQIIGWLYQFYNIEQNELVYDGSMAKSRIPKELLSAATTIYTPDWPVKYMVENSLGKLWINQCPDTSLKEAWDYYLDIDEQSKEQESPFLRGEIKSRIIKPEELRIIDPCQGSGHILCVLFDQLICIYEDYGYSAREAASSIVKNNLWGLDIDDRAAQLAYFSVMMKARQYDRRFFSRAIQPNVYAIRESNLLDSDCVNYFINGNSEIRLAINTIIDSLYDAKEYGSIISIPKVNYAVLYNRIHEIENEIDPTIYSIYTVETVLPLIKLAEAMSNVYDVVITNPPYLSSSRFSPKLSEYVKKKYPDVKNDLSMVMYKHALVDLCKPSGYVSFITTSSWMFLSSFEKVRSLLFSCGSISSLIDFGTELFEGKVGHNPIVAWVTQKSIKNDHFMAVRLVDYCYSRRDEKEKQFFSPSNRFIANQKDFSKVPLCPIAYWLGEEFFSCFEKGKKIGAISKARRGLETGNNEKYLRYWQEVDLSDIDLNCSDISSFHKKWLPHNKGGNYRTWYGNLDYVVYFADDGAAIRKSGVLNGYDVYCREGITWTALTGSRNSFRYTHSGCTFDSNKGPLIPDDGSGVIYYILAVLNSCVGQLFISVLNPSVSLQNGDIDKVPIIFRCQEEITSLVKECIDIARDDWDCFENSLDFQKSPLIRNVRTIKEAFSQWAVECDHRFDRCKEIEYQINKTLIETYGFENVLSPDISDSIISIRKADLNRDIKNLIAYSVGCMFGRYSLDCLGIVNTGGALDTNSYRSFKVDTDNIIPICDDEYFRDDIVGLFVNFIKCVYGSETLEENLAFIANALGGKGNTREVIRKYFINEFYSDHCSNLSGNAGKRPIYWLFDSGKKNGFKCLIYMHRYQPDTIARIRTDYVHEQQSRYRTAIADLESRIANAGTSERVKLTKQLDGIRGQAEELRVYEEKIHHLADQMIKIDLDDGVKVNYAKFQDVLAKIK